MLLKRARIFGTISLLLLAIADSVSIVYLANRRKNFVEMKRMLIVNGIADTIPNNFVRIVTEVPFRMCGGAMIGPHWVITASRCVVGKNG